MAEILSLGRPRGQLTGIIRLTGIVRLRISAERRRRRAKQLRSRGDLSGQDSRGDAKRAHPTDKTHHYSSKTQ
ncbi:hypothetical protein [Rhodopseudomonas pseudopalustris]|uniref:hypothetical protein n=1 Tax=Rhodopseudomonas pseudopalustris TaxID=1513892 RepID=UPI001FCD7170|nr:hypothetical protein [Rhodopseudomonas pseudopalustris]